MKNQGLVLDRKVMQMSVGAVAMFMAGAQFAAIALSGFRVPIGTYLIFIVLSILGPTCCGMAVDDRLHRAEGDDESHENDGYTQ